MCQRSDRTFTAAESIFNLPFPCFFVLFSWPTGVLPARTTEQLPNNLTPTPDSCSAAGNDAQTFPPRMHQTPQLRQPGARSQKQLFFLRPSFISLPLTSEGFRTRKTFSRVQPCTDSSSSPSVIFSPAVGLLLVFPPELPLNATIQCGSVTWSRISPPDPNPSAAASQKCSSTIISVRLIQQKQSS